MIHCNDSKQFSQINHNDNSIKHYIFESRSNAEQELEARYGRRYIEYRKRYELASNLQREFRFPIYIMLEQTYRCNLRCTYCIHGYPNLRKRYDLGIACMPLDLYKRIIVEGEKFGCPSIAMMNNDEPLLVKDLGERIALAKRHGFMDIIMTTNGNLMTEKNIKEIIDAGITKILFSIDAATEKTYKKVRFRGDFKKVIWAIEKITAYREKLKTNLPILRASFVPSSANQHEIGLFLKKFSKMVDYIDVQPFLAYYKANLKFVPNNAPKVNSFRCNQPWRNLIVRGNGEVLPCCSFYGPEIVVGNLYWNSLYEIFNYGLMKQIRKDSKEGYYRNVACKECANAFYKLKL